MERQSAVPKGFRLRQDDGPSTVGLFRLGGAMVQE